MKPIHFPEVNCAFGANQPEYLPLPACRSEGPDGLVTSCWLIEPEEMKELVSKFLLGQPIHVWIGQLTFGHELQPIRVGMEPPIFEPLPPTSRQEES